MNINTLKIFKTVAQTGNFSLAAKKLDFVQSHVSTQIKKLEDEIGYPLFSRFNRGCRLTLRGESLLKYADRIISILDEVEMNVKNEDLSYSKIRISSTQISALEVLPQVLSEFHREFSSIQISINTANVVGALASVQNAESDLAVIADDFEVNGLTYESIGDEKLCLVGVDKSCISDTGKPVSIVVFKNGCAYRKKLEQFLYEKKVVIGNTTECDNLSCIISCVCAGCGISLLPLRMVKPYLVKGSLKLIDDRIKPLPLKLVMRENFTVNHVYKRFIELLKKEYRKPYQI